MKFRVFIVADAEEDLFEIYRHISMYDSPQKTEKLRTHLEEVCLGLSEFPDRAPRLRNWRESEFSNIRKFIIRCTELSIRLFVVMSISIVSWIVEGIFRRCLKNVCFDRFAPRIKKLDMSQFLVVKGYLFDFWPFT